MGATVIVSSLPGKSRRGRAGQLAAVTDVVVVNEAEAAHWDLQTPHRVVTRGARGRAIGASTATSTCRHRRWSRSTPPGAGDVFRRVLAAHWATGPTGAAAARGG